MAPTSGRVTIAWDVDDVLNDLTREWACWAGLESQFAAGHGSDPAEYVASLGFPKERYLASLDEFRALRYASLRPSGVVLDWLDRNGGRCDHVAITRTPLAAEATMRRWVDAHFGAWITEVFVSPSMRVTDPPGTTYPSKGEIVRSLGGDVVLIDDTEDNLASARGICESVAFAQPWNTADDQQSALEGIAARLAESEVRAR